MGSGEGPRGAGEGEGGEELGPVGFGATLAGVRRVGLSNQPIAAGAAGGTNLAKIGGRDPSRSSPKPEAS